MKSYIGIDISKLTLDINDYGKATSCNNDDKGIKTFIRKLKRRVPKKGLPLLIIEASDGYEKRLVNACHQSNIPIHVCHANKVRAFAKSKGVLAKTDQIDAKILSEYGRVMDCQQAKPLLTENGLKIKKLLDRREQLNNDRQRERNRLDKISDEFIKAPVNRRICRSLDLI